jgi:eukaryotic-like serine/threonine-protein kinase
MREVDDMTTGPADGGAEPEPKPGVSGTPRPRRSTSRSTSRRAGGRTPGRTPGRPARASSRAAGGHASLTAQALVAGRYRLEELVSQQDDSSVWKATDESLARAVTVFVLSAGAVRADEAITAARAAARLSDPRLVQIFDADDRGDLRYIVTEWPTGERLDQVIAAGPLDSRLAAEIVAEVAGAVAAGHAAGLAHLCLTPDLVWRNRWGEVKLSGLGTAAALAGAQEDDPALADARGLARLLYAALTGRWPGPEQTGLPAAEYSGDRPDSPGQLRVGIPADIDALTCRALFGDNSNYGPPILNPAGLAVALSAIAHPTPDTQPLSALPGQTQPFAPVPASTRPLPVIPDSAAIPDPPATPDSPAVPDPAAIPDSPAVPDPAAIPHSPAIPGSAAIGAQDQAAAPSSAAGPEPVAEPAALSGAEQPGPAEASAGPAEASAGPAEPAIAGPADPAPDDTGQAEDPAPERPQPATHAAAEQDVAGPEGAGPQSAGPEGAEPESARPESAGPEAAGPEAAGPEAAGPESAGPEGTGPAAAGQTGGGPDGPQPAGHVGAYPVELMPDWMWAAGQGPAMPPSGPLPDDGEPAAAEPAMNPEPAATAESATIADLFAGAALSADAGPAAEEAHPPSGPAGPTLVSRSLTRSRAALGQGSARAQARLGQEATRARAALGQGSTRAQARLSQGASQAQARLIQGSTRAQARLSQGASQAQARLGQGSTRAQAMLGQGAARARAALGQPDRFPVRLPALPAPLAGRVRTALVVLVLVVCAVVGWVLGHGAAQPGSPAAPAGSAGASVHHVGRPAGILRPASAATFDPYGDGQGSQLARLAIDASPVTAWHTAWYTTATFGNLKPGTGLLINMGRRVTITAVRITLGRAAGADFQLRAGSEATSLGRLSPVARAAGAGGQVRLRLAQPARARYLLIWFTKLPPDPSGTFEASVYNVRLQGSP